MQIESPYSRSATDTLDTQIRFNKIDNGNGLQCHVLEAGDPTDHCSPLLHGFPELSYSWRKVMVPLAEAGFHVLAPDQRGYGQTTGSPASSTWHCNPLPLSILLNRIRESSVSVADRE